MLDNCGFKRDHIKLFQEILKEESLVRSEWAFSFFDKQEPEYILSQVVQLFEIADASIIPETYIKKYHLRTDEHTLESIYTQVNLVYAIFSRALANLSYHVDLSEDKTDDYQLKKLSHYTLGEIIEAIILYYLPNNQTSSSSELLKDIRPDGSLIGQMLYLSSKTAVIITALIYDSRNLSVKMSIEQCAAFSQGYFGITRCDFHKDNYYKSSEVRTMDFFEIRQLTKCDHTGYFTAIIIMATLIVNNTWYAWRKIAYAKYHQNNHLPPTLSLV